MLGKYFETRPTYFPITYKAIWRYCFIGALPQITMNGYQLVWVSESLS